ncbi:hypothetical protein G9A89_005983 [Geosiphon pyriformis]|nr:hypothetical protein G9A89_005983 [Geosiphon pyriformis]
MFGSGAFGGFGQQNPSQNQQPGQNSQLPQLQVTPPAQGMFGAATNTGFGTFGAPAASSATGGFGGFGAAAGANTAAQPFGFVTGTNTAPPSSGGLFGVQNSSFGLGGTQATSVVPERGTAAPPYTSTSEKDQTAGLTNHFHSISAMPAYKNFSFEELRLKDYELGRKPGSTTATTSATLLGAGVGSNFGATNQNATAFGAASNPSSAFGASSNTPFGAGTSFGLSSNTTSFGATKPTISTGFGGFGSNTNTAFGSNAATPTVGGGLFAAQSKPAFGAGFGTGPGISSGLTGGLGSTNALGGGGSNFFGGSGNTGTSMFGAKPTVATTAPFGQSASNQTAGFVNTNTFGFGNTTKPTAPTGGLFSVNTTPAASGNVFGGLSSSQSNTGASGFGAFNNTNATKPSGFGLGTQSSTTNAFAPAPSSSSLFANLGTPQTSSGSSTFNFNKPTTTPSTFNLQTPLTGTTNVSSFTLGSNTNTNSLGSYTTTLTTQPNQTNIEQTPYGVIPALNTIAPSTTSYPQTISTPTKSNRKKPVTPHYKLAPKPSVPLKARVHSPAVQGSLSTVDLKNKPLHIFDGLSKPEALSPDAFSRKSRGLVIDRPVTDIGAMNSSRPYTNGFKGESIFKIEPKTPDNQVGSSKVGFQSYPVESTTFGGILNDLDQDIATPTKSPNPFKTPIFTPVKTPTPKISSSQTIAQLLEDSETGSPSPKATPKTNGTSNQNGDSGLSNTDGYWISPPLEELKSMDEKEIKKVTNFQVGRTGYGQISFDDGVDLSSVPLDQIAGKIVQFDTRTCIVYPDENFVPKPPVGEGLNRPARITLQKCWALDKSTRQPIKDPNDKRYRQRIQRLQETPETDFIDFYAETGSWIFHVNHFSKYGLELESEEDEFEERDLIQPKPHLLAFVVAKGKNDENASGTHKPSPAQVIPKKTAPSKGLAESLRLDPNSVYEMTAALFRSTDQAPRALDPVASSRPSPYTIGKRNMSMDMEIETENELSLPSPEAELRPSFSIISPPLPQLQFVRRGRPNKFRRISYSKSIPYQKDGYLQDAGLAMSRSFRVGWGPNGTLVHCGKVCGIKEIWTDQTSETESGLPTTIYCERLKIFADPNEDHERVRHIKILKALLQHSEIVLDSEGIPLALTSSKLTHSVFAEVANHSMFTDHERSIWKLGHILWDEQDIPGLEKQRGDRQEEIKEETRKLNISNWLQKNVKKKAENHLNACISKKDNLGTIISYLSEHEIGKATLNAIQNRDFRLATLIPQLAGCDTKFRDLIQTQIQHWETTNAARFIPDEHWKIYQILAGNVKEINKVEMLDWKRSLAMHVWYGVPLEARFSESFEQYEDSLKDNSLPNEPKVSPPTPWYFEEPRKGLRQWKYPDMNDSEQSDVLFHLLKCWVNPGHELKNILNPRSISPSPLDFRVSFLLYMLTRSTISEIDEHCFEQVTQSFMFQLERLGLWQWAIFVALHFKEGKIRAHAIKELLTRYLPFIPEYPKDIDNSVDNIQQFLIESLKVKPVHIAEAKSVAAKYNEDIYMEARNYLEAEQHSVGHDLIIKEIAPKAILLEKYGDLCSLLERVDSARVPSWRLGGGLYLNIVELLIKQSQFKEIPEERKGPDEQRDLQRLCQEVLTTLEKVVPVNPMQERCFAFVETRAKDLLKFLVGERPNSMEFLPDE